MTTFYEAWQLNQLVLNNVRHVNYKMGKHKTGWRCRMTDDGESVLMLKGVGHTMQTRVIASGTAQEKLDAMVTEFVKPEWREADVMIITKWGD